MNDWLRYSTLGIEMAIIIAILVFAGVKIDAVRNHKFPIFTILFTFISITVVMLRLWKISKSK